MRMEGQEQEQIGEILREILGLRRGKGKYGEGRKTKDER
jgi:hypothetical protein